MTRPQSITWHDTTAWIWTTAAERPYHNVVCFRRAFEVAAAGVAVLRITADTRYEVHLNGRWLGFGPARSWPASVAVDEYDLTGLFRLGRNALCVLVHHFGLSTFQSLHSEPGLIGEIEWQESSGTRRIGTDATWRARRSDAHLWPVPRVSCQRGWEEQFDSRRIDPAWVEPAFDDHLWPAADVMFMAADRLDRAFVPRGVPQLTRDPTPPVRLLAVEGVKSAPYVWSINPRDLLNPADKSANFVRGRLLLATNIVSDSEQSIQFHRPHVVPWADWKLNGESLKFDDRSLQQTEIGVAHAALRRGPNLLLGRLKDNAHHWWAVLNAWTDRPIALENPSPVAMPTAWLALGPFGDKNDRSASTDGMSVAVVDAAAFASNATRDVFDRIFAAGLPTATDLASAYARPVTADMIALDDIYARCASERVIAQHARVDCPDALLQDNAEWTTIHPVNTGDVRLLLDFGREVVGFHEIELDAPVGCVIDNHNFEFIQPDGRFNLTEGMNNSFRYVCREGVQQYRTLLRRGFRYSWLSFRAFDRPVRVRQVRVLMSTYPQVRRGSFNCSDPLLDRVWEIGAHSVACCSEDTYTDCPTYEQTFWVGDGRNEALVDLVANGDPRLSARSLRLAAESLQRSPIIESQVPSGWHNLLPAWSFLWMRWAQEHFELTGDRELGQDLVVANAKQVEGLRHFLSERGLITMAAWNMFDWAAMDTPSGGEVTHLNCLAVLGLRQAARLARDVDRPADAAAWDALADELAAAVNRHLWDERRQAYIDCIRPDGVASVVLSQQTQTAAYIAGVADGPRAARCRAIMHDAPDGFVKAGSPFFMFFVLEALVREGQYDQLLETIRGYWGPQVDAGATTFWEMYYRDRARLTRSHCHGWSAAPTYFLSRYVLGVSPAEPGYTRIRIEPNAGGLTWARGAVPTPRGVVESSWRSNGGRFSVRIVIPEGTEAQIVWPVANVATMTCGTLLGQDGQIYCARGPVIELHSSAPNSG